MYLERKTIIIALAIVLAIILALSITLIAVCNNYKKVETVAYAYNFTEAQKDLMARVLWVEAGSNSRKLQTYCASVMVNQLDDGHYGDTIEKVLTYCNNYSGYKYLYRADGKDISACREVVEEICKNGSALPSYVLFFASGGHNWGDLQTYEIIEGVHFEYYTEAYRALYH